MMDRMRCFTVALAVLLGSGAALSAGPVFDVKFADDTPGQPPAVAAAKPSKTAVNSKPSGITVTGPETPPAEAVSVVVRENVADSQTNVPLKAARAVVLKDLSATKQAAIYLALAGDDRDAGSKYVISWELLIDSDKTNAGNFFITAAAEKPIGQSNSNHLAGLQIPLRAGKGLVVLNDGQQVRPQPTEMVIQPGRPVRMEVVLDFAGKKQTWKLDGQEAGTFDLPAEKLARFTFSSGSTGKAMVAIANILVEKQ